MRRFKSAKHAQSFLSIYFEVGNLFNLRRHLIKANHYRNDRKVAFVAWAEAIVCELRSSFTYYPRQLTFQYPINTTLIKH